MVKKAATKDDAPVLFQRKGPVGTLILNRPEKHNALNSQVWAGLDQAMDGIESETDLRVILLQGAGPSFCAGLDLSPENELLTLVMQTASASQKTAFFKELRGVQKTYNRLAELPQPVIGVIQGHCLGGGLELALTCDFLLCSQDAVFGLPEPKLALITDLGGLQRLPRFVGRGQAREIAFRGHRFGGLRAQEIGLVSETFPDRDILEKAAWRIAEEIAANAPLAVQGAKEVMNYSEEVSLSQGLEYTAGRSAMVLPSKDLEGAIQAFMNKKPAKFQGE